MVFKHTFGKKNIEIMKKNLLLFTVVLVALTVSTINVSGQSKTEKAQVEKISINKKGEIHDHGWNKLGFITKDNIVKNNQGKTIYFIDGSGNVIDSKGNNLGKHKRMVTIIISRVRI